MPPGAWMAARWGCGVFSFRGLCNEPIPRPRESNRLHVYVCVCVFYWVRSEATINLYIYSEQVGAVRVRKKENCSSTIWLFFPHFVKLFYRQFLFSVTCTPTPMFFYYVYEYTREKHRQCLLFKPRNRVTVISMLTVRIGDWFQRYFPFMRQLHRI
jgi:hypothetical protein